MITGDSKLKNIEEGEQLFTFSGNGNKLMSKVLSNDKQVIDDGKLILEATNYGLNEFNSEMIFEQITKNFSFAENLLGETTIGLLTEYNPNFIKKNLHLPEFRKELKARIARKIEELKERKMISEDCSITRMGAELSSVMLYREELDKLASRRIEGKGEKIKNSNGLKDDVKEFRGENYRDIAIRKTLKRAIRRGHQELDVKDLMSYDRKTKEESCIIFALDASGSMRGYKIKQCKKAGIALAYKAIDEKNKVGLIVFGPEVKKSIAPTNNFSELITEIAGIRAANETNIPATIREAIKLFPSRKLTKHLIVVSDALPTIGEKPEQETLEAVSAAKDAGITVSVVGIKLGEKGKELAEKMAEIGGGRLYIARDLENLDLLVLEDYRQLRQI